MSESTDTQAPQSIPLSLDGYFFAINADSNLGIPAVFFDDTVGSEAVLLFTSEESARKYCYMLRPDETRNIYQLERKRTTDIITGKSVITQSELIRISRNIRINGLDQIKNFVIDHPGTRGAAKYLSIEAMADLGRVPVPKDVSTLDEFEKFVSDTLED